MNIKEANAKVEQCPSTVFDTFNLQDYMKGVGGGLRDDLVKMTALYSRISQLANNATRLYEEAQDRCNEVEAMAWSKLDKDLKATQQKIAVRLVSVEYEDEITNLVQEDKRVSLFSFINSRGKAKMAELSSLLDVGRTLLSWDKQEVAKGQY